MGKRVLKTEATKQKLLDAVETILAEDGFTALKVESISAKSGVDKKLIYFHFGDLKGLLNAFLRSRDFWYTKIYANMDNIELTMDGLQNVLENQFNTIFDNRLLQQLLVWELADGNDLLKELSSERDSLSDALINALIEKEGIIEDIRPMIAVLVAGIYYLSIHTHTNGSTFVGLDLKDKKDRQCLLTTIKKIVTSMVAKSDALAG